MSAGQAARPGGDAFVAHVPGLSRRRFLARCGALGAMATLSQVRLGTSSAHAAGAGEVNAALALTAKDTIAGLIAFSVPGPDAYSRAQGLTDSRPGGIAANAAAGAIEGLDRYIALPDTFAQSMAAGFATGLSEVPMPALDPVIRSGEQVAVTVDEAFLEFSANDSPMPASLLVALMLNFVATEVAEAAVVGPFPGSPFANLNWAEKGEVFRRIEEDHASLLALIDGGASEPARASYSGLISLLGGQLLAFAAIYSYSEWHALDPASSTLGQRPVGWDLTDYQPGMRVAADGWNEMRGYYGGHRRARPTRIRSRRRRDA